MPSELESGLVLGYVDGVATSNATFAPVLHWDHGTTRAVEPTDFPNRERIVLFHQTLARERGIWIVEWTKSHTYDETRTRSDKYKGELKDQIESVLDFRAVDEETIIATIQQGFASRNVSPRAYLWIDDEVAVGPVDVTRDGQRYLVPSDELVDPIKAWRIDRSSMPVATDRLGYVTPPRKNWRHAGLVDWSSNATILTRVLQNIRKLDSRFGDAMNITAKSIDRMSEVIKNGINVTDAFLLRQRLSRARRICAEELELLTSSEQVERFVLELPRVKNLIARATEQTAAEVAVATKTRVESELADVSRQVEERVVKRDALDIDIRKITRDIEELSIKLSDEANAFESALCDRISEASANAAQFVADAVLLNAALHPARQQRKHILDRDGVAITTWHDAVKQLQARFALSSLNVELSDTVLAVFTCGVMVVTPTEGALPLLRDLANVLCGGCLLTVPMSPRILSFGDLMSTAVLNAADPSTAVQLKEVLWTGEPKVINFHALNVVDFDLVFQPLLTADLPAGTILCGSTVRGGTRMPLTDCWSDALLFDPTCLGLRRPSVGDIRRTHLEESLFSQLRSASANDGAYDRLCELANQHLIDLTRSHRTLNAFARASSLIENGEKFVESAVCHAITAAYVTDRDRFHRFVEELGLSSHRLDLHLKAADGLIED